MIKSNVNKKVSGKNIKIGNYYSLYCKKKFSKVVSKYAVKAISYSSNIIKRKYYYKVKLNLAIIHLSKILRRHYRKIKNENKGNKQIRLLKESFLLYNLR